MNFAELSAIALTAPSTIAEIKKALPVPYVLDVYNVPTQVQGQKIVAVCPFHDDHDPSLDVYGEHLDRFGCYPCGAGGDVLDLIARLEGLDGSSAKVSLRKAQEILADMPDDWRPPVVESAPRVFDTEAETRYVQDAEVRDPEALGVFLYESSSRSPALGAIPVDWLRAEFRVGSDGHRIVMPVYDREGTLVAYKRRTPTTKAMSAAGSALSNVLYGEWRDVDRSLPVLLCEGETDTWAAAYHVPDHIALGLPAGAGAHPRQAQTLANRDVTICFDGDRAGRDAAFKWAKALRAEGCVVRVSPLPDGFDIASLDDPAPYLLNKRPLLAAPDGIAIQDGAYVRPGSEFPTVLTNWFLEPEVELAGTDGATAYIGTIQPSDQQTTISSYDLSSKQRVVAWALRNGGAWYGSDKDAQQLLGHLQAGGPFLVPGKMGTVAGLHDGHFIYPNGVIGYDNWQYVPPPNTIHLEEKMDLTPGQWFPAQVHALRALHSKAVTDPILAWMALAPIRSLFRQFPILAVTGSSGSGKTTLLETMLWNFTGSLITTNLTSTTPHALFSFVGSTNAFPVWFDEYRPGARKLTLESLQQVIRDAYTGQSSSKGGMGDKWSEVTTVPAQAPMVITGEDAFSETSHTERMVLLNLPIHGRNPLVLDDIRTWEDHGLPHAYLSWVQHHLTYDLINTTVQPLPESDLPTRQRHNIGLLLLGWRLLDEFVQHYGGDPLHSMNLDIVLEGATEAASHNPIMDALVWCNDEVNAAEFFRNTEGTIYVRPENFVTYVNSKSDYALPGGPEAIRRYLRDHYGAISERVQIAGKQCRAMCFPANKIGL